MFLVPTPPRVESAAKSPALILASGPGLVSCSRAAQGRGLPAFTTVVKPRPSGQPLAFLSEAPASAPRKL